MKVIGNGNSVKSQRRFKACALVLSLVALHSMAGVSSPTYAVTQAGGLSAETRADGLWYENAIGLSAARSEGLTGKGVRVAVVDTGINLQAAELQGAQISVHDGFCLNQDTGQAFPGNSKDPAIASHGTGVTAMLVGNGLAADGGKGATGIAPDAQVDFYAVGPLVSEDQKAKGWSSVCPSNREADGSYSGDAWKDAFSAAVDSGAEIISVSLSGALPSFRDTLAKAISRGITVVASVPNPGAASVRVGSFPAGGNGSLAVNAVGQDLKVIGESAKSEKELPYALGNMGVAAPGVNILSVGSDGSPAIENGTSVAAPLVAGVLALASQKFPEATQNQLLQALIHSTDNGSHGSELSWDRFFGYGVVSLSAVLDKNPKSYPDRNPLFADTPDDPRCKSDDATEQPTAMSDCSWANTPTADQVKAAGLAKPSNSNSANPDQGKQSVDYTILVLIAGLGVSVIVAILIVMTQTRKKRRIGSQSPANQNSSLVGGGAPPLPNSRNTTGAGTGQQQNEKDTGEKR